MRSCALKNVENRFVPVQDGSRHICDRCGEVGDPSRINADDQVISCPQCGHEHHYSLVPPLLFLTGANGVGKTSVLHELLGSIDDAILIDGEFLWNIDPAHDYPGSGYRLFRSRLFGLGMRIARNGVPVVIEGAAMPWEYEQLPHRPLVSRTAYLALVCDDAELVRRLHARGASRWPGNVELIEGVVQTNRVFKQEAGNWTPEVALIDTTDITVSQTAASVGEWIQNEVAIWRRSYPQAADLPS